MKFTSVMELFWSKVCENKKVIRWQEQLDSLTLAFSIYTNKTLALLPLNYNLIWL